MNDKRVEAVAKVIWKCLGPSYYESETEYDKLYFLARGKMQDAATAALAALDTGEVEPITEFCEWAVEDSDTGVWETGCGDVFTFCHTWTSDEREGFDFCPFCGKQIRV